MEGQRIFFSEKEGVYYYVTYGDSPSCDVCNEEINRVLVYQTIWMKKSEDVKTHHVRCFKKIQHRGHVDEFKNCVVIEDVPEDVLPIFERRPTLTNRSGYNVSEVSKILKGSEAEIKDRTRISKDPSQYQTIGYEKNLISFKKRDEELGPSIFLLNDMARDEIKQLTCEHEKDENFISCTILKIEDVDIVERKKVYYEKKQEYQDENFDLIQKYKEEDVDNFFEKVRDSKILPAQADALELINCEIDTEEIEYKPKDMG